MNRSRLSAPAALLACLHLSGCLSDDGEPYRIAFRRDGTVNAVAVFPQSVGDPASPPDPDLRYVPFTTEADKAADTAYRDKKEPQRLESFTSVFCITAVKPYRVLYQIVDASDRIAFRGAADFGSAGEFQNVNRVALKGLLGCLEWDLGVANPLYRSDLQRPGLYRWQVEFTFDDPGETFFIERAFAVLRWPYVYP